MFPAPYLEVKVRLVKGDAVWSCGLFYKPQGSVTAIDPGGDMVALANQVQSDIAQHFKEVLPDSCEVANCQVKLIKDSSTLIDALADSGEYPGTNATTPAGTLPDEDAACLQRLTGRTLPRNRGRIMVPLVPYSFQDAGTLTTLGKSRYQSLAHELAQPKTLAGISWNPVHPNRADNELVTITEWRVNTVLKSQRRRRSPRQGMAIPSVAPTP